MRKYWLIAMLLVSVNLFAGDSGSYYNIERDGEGLQLSRSGDQVQFFFYTYDDWQGCPSLNIPKGGLVDSTNCHENRWFFSDANVIDEKRGTVEGWLYTGVGVNYPKGVVDPQDPFLSVVGQGYVVGRFILQRSGDGWRMVVVRFGNLLAKGDSLFSEVFEFNTMLFPADG